ncbi:MAG: glutamate 5-kinase [Treponema sp.]|nr:glutamate 5-kinase [Treponema sp.]
MSTSPVFEKSDSLAEHTEQEAVKNLSPTSAINIAKIIKQSKKIVIKIGSNTLADTNGKPNAVFMENLARQCSEFLNNGKQIVIVSSGAQVCGLSTINGWAHKKDMHYRQALCAIGQVELMEQWRLAFRKFNLHIGQLLLTKNDFLDAHCSLNIRNTLFTLVDENIVPIINENDSVAFDEIAIGDNDNLSALIANLWSADLLILFSDVDGIYTDNPKTNKNARLVETVNDISALRKTITIGEANSFGTGGIETKIVAAEFASEHGIPLLLAKGTENALENLSSGKAHGTLFLAAT